MEMAELVLKDNVAAVDPFPNQGSLLSLNLLTPPYHFLPPLPPVGSSKPKSVSIL